MSQELTKTIIYSEEQFKKLIHWIESKETSGEIDVRIIASYVLIALHHFDSIIQLIKCNNRISASTLARPHYESFLRATWLSINEDKPKVKKAVNYLSKGKDEFPNLWKMAKEIENELKIDFYDKKLIKAFHNYTHGGSHMVARCMDEETISPQFTDEEMIGLLKGITINSLLTVLAYASKINDKELADKCNNKIKELTT